MRRSRAPPSRRHCGPPPTCRSRPASSSSARSTAPWRSRRIARRAATPFARNANRTFRGNRMAWRKASICGVGQSRQGKLPEETPVTLAAEALRNALEDSGIDKSEIDGLMTLPGTSAPEAAKNYLVLGERLGINPRFTGSLVMGGATAGACVELAAMAAQNGMAQVVARHVADPPR